MDVFSPTASSTAAACASSRTPWKFETNPRLLGGATIARRREARALSPHVGIGMTRPENRGPPRTGPHARLNAMADLDGRSSRGGRRVPLRRTPESCERASAQSDFSEHNAALTRRHTELLVQ